MSACFSTDSLGSKTQYAVYKYEDSEFPHAIEQRTIMFSDLTCGAGNQAVSIAMGYNEVHRSDPLVCH